VTVTHDWGSRQKFPFGHFRVCALNPKIPSPFLKISTFEMPGELTGRVSRAYLRPGLSNARQRRIAILYYFCKLALIDFQISPAPIVPHPALLS
jgi:hypothetical protein